MQSVVLNLSTWVYYWSSSFKATNHPAPRIIKCCLLFKMCRSLCMAHSSESDVVLLVYHPPNNRKPHPAARPLTQPKYTHGVREHWWSCCFSSYKRQSKLINKAKVKRRKRRKRRRRRIVKGDVERTDARALVLRRRSCDRARPASWPEQCVAIKRKKRRRRKTYDRK
jgi:hypothetical protein